MGAVLVYTEYNERGVELYGAVLDFVMYGSGIAEGLELIQHKAGLKFLKDDYIFLIVTGPPLSSWQLGPAGKPSVHAGETGGGGFPMTSRAIEIQDLGGTSAGHMAVIGE